MKIEQQDLRFRDSNNFQSIPQLQILVLGDGSTGKTSLLNILTQRKYPIKIKSDQSKIPIKTQGCDIKIAMRNYSNKKVLLKMIDLSGDKSQRQYLDVYISRLKLDAIIFCFDVTNLKTLDHLGKWIKRLTVKDAIDQEMEEFLDTDRSDFSLGSTTAVSDGQDSLLNYHNYNGIPMKRILQTPFIFIGCKIDLIPSDNHIPLRQQVQKRIQQFYKRSNTVILLSTINPSVYSDQFNLLENYITRIYQWDMIEDFFIQDQIQSKRIPIDESFWKETIQIKLQNKLQYLYVFVKHFCQKLLFKKMKRDD
ncbi:unnamed protein product (macronuclear) [Paramecium tetraurelia]|uniref:P-loop containing nucleoside triphosphate hydrolase n=1 Tax=Paramecium tetraurelia TaxID=5888 RepID=A0C7J4_PARTE|nr:uncharacterized protein GSPATT00035891001 [Paramecium tetraurelia]CAK66761.1 unnamed protein product [Paramecium tetraurelia]|eukprot:XP_001434158.1 hypothetical protein (macronuclear) [Paramecium tetraurelia strain d4-2]